MNESPSRWQRCIYHWGTHGIPFLQRYLPETHRKILLIAGAGFDPRSTTICDLIAEAAQGRAHGCFIREERPRPDPVLLARADRNEEAMRLLMSTHSVEHLEIFASDNAVVGGRAAVQLADRIALEEFTDVFVDLSALSIGVAFPMVRHLFDRVQNCATNLHLVVVDEPRTDGQIHTVAGDSASTVHGFKGGWGLDQHSNAAKLWIPQLSRNKGTVLERIHLTCQPHAVCPVLPFPASNPRLADELIEHYREQFESTWQVDARDIVYASESNPLDLYRTILRIDDARKRVFAEVGGSQIILSPLGSKALAVGALMAAMDRDFTVIYVEAVAYTADLQAIDASRDAGEVVHVWLHGEAYAKGESAQ